MDQKFQTSFIPKKSVQSPTKYRASSGMSILLLISIVIFFISVGIGGWVFLEKKIIIRQINEEQQTIESNKSGLLADSITVDALVELDTRINLSKQLLSRHTDVTPVFDFLQNATLKNVQFKSFRFSSGGQTSDGVSGVNIQLSGQGRDFETVAIQADDFGKQEWKNIIREPKVSGVSLNSDGSVSFSFAATIVPEYLSYAKATQ